MSETIRTREEIPAQYKWNAASVYPSDEAWEAEADSLLVKLAEVKRMEGSVGKSAQALAEAGACPVGRSGGGAGARAGPVRQSLYHHERVDEQRDEISQCLYK